MIQKILVFIILLTVSIGVQSLFAQQIVSGATLRGVTTDTNDAVIRGAKVTAINLETNQAQTTISDSNGQFRFSYLPVGNYEIKAEQTGFITISQKITLTVGQILELELTFQINNVSYLIDVNTDTPIVETTRTQVTETILPADVENLPLNGRNFLDLALLIPGVSRTNTGSVQRFAETSAVPGTGLSVSGQRNLNNSFIVDGSSANDDAAELAGTYYSQEVIREFQIVTSGAVAEFGRAQSGFINIVTQSGTNNRRGKIYGFLRDDKFDARNPLATSKDPLTQTQYGLSLGAPIIKNRAFFFGNFEQTRRNDTNIITISPVNVAAINNRLTQAGYRGQMLQNGLVPGGYDTTNFFGRIDHQINSKNSFAATYNFYDIKAVNARTVGGLNAVSRGTNLENRDHTLNLQNITTIGSRSLNEFRFQYRKSNLAAPVIDEIGSAVNISGVANFGTSTVSPTKRDIDLFQISDSFGTTFENHSLKFGGEFLYNRANIAFPGAIQGVYTFTNLNNFLAGNYSQFQQAFGATEQKQNNPNIAFFVQDEWKARTNLTLNFGLRYDAQLLPDPIKTDSNNFAPRFGFAYSPFPKTVIRGSFGLYYDRIPLRAVSNALQRDGSKYVVIQLSPSSPGAPVFPNVLSAVPSTLLVKPNITRIDPNIENSYSQQANLQIERELPFDTSFSVGYIYLRGLHLILSRNVNVPRCASSVNPNLCRPDPNFGNISRYEGSGDSYFNGLVISFNKRAKNWASFRLSYTLSKTIDNAGNFFFFTPQDNFNLRDERGLSDNDQRHRFILSGTLNTPSNIENSLARKIFGGFQFSYIFNYASSLPFNIVTGNDRNGDTTNNDRPLGVGRNTGKGFDFASLDMRLSRRFNFSERINLELIAEGFNVLNRANYSVPNNTFGTGIIPNASFGKPTAAFDSRQIQLGMRLSF
ncbi:MAG: carboxypeptidase regulatory-like domain-containing protein [Pyrinomonadaceae bacterium]